MRRLPWLRRKGKSRSELGVTENLNDSSATSSKSNLAKGAEENASVVCDQLVPNAEWMLIERTGRANRASKSSGSLCPLLFRVELEILIMM
jgi:hypothetical protein